ncbi:MAG: hypothetical protein EAZ36_03500 [Verrucomicrobia bacterium]|nr:MAG: hypothetical protein EAZ36_03500 [Verrucomicrobiota bacterium]
MKKPSATPAPTAIKSAAADRPKTAKPSQKKPAASAKLLPPVPAAPPAPAPKLAKPSAKTKVAAKTTVPKVKAAPVVAKAVAPMPKPVARKPTKTPKPATVPPELRAAYTLITAKVDVGFGNTLFLRGEGAGLSWELGLPMTCDATDRWMISLPETDKPLLCKFLLNDTIWSVGDDYTVLPGSKVALAPTFSPR